MLKKTITYTDYNGTSRTEDFYFNLSKPEIIELEASEAGGLGAMLEEMVKSNDSRMIVSTFKTIILKAYGKKSEDGRRFIKTDELRTEFEQSEAFSELFMELATSSSSAAAFVNGILPKSIAEEAAKLAAKDGASAVLASAT